MLKSLILAAAVSGLSVLALPAAAEQAPEAASSLIAGPAVKSQSASIDRRDRTMIRASVETFIWGLSHRQAAPVWAFAPEMMQQKLKNENTALVFFSRVHPQLANARSLSFDGIRMIGDVPVAGFYVKDKGGRQWFAVFGIARRADGAWNIAFCRIFAAPGILI